MTCPLSGTNDQILAGYFALLTASLLPRGKRTFDTEQESKHPSHLPCCVNDQILPSILHCRPILTPAEQMISFDTGKRRSSPACPHRNTSMYRYLDIPHRRPCPHSLETNEPLALARDTTRRAHPWRKQICKVKPRQGPLPALNACVGSLCSYMKTLPFKSCEVNRSVLWNARRWRASCAAAAVRKPTAVSCRVFPYIPACSGPRTTSSTVSPMTAST